LIDSIPYLDSITTQKLVSSLLKSERLIFLDFLKTWWSDSFFVVLKEQLVGFINALTDILNGLRAYQLPEGITFPQLGYVFLKFGTVQVFAPHQVVPTMKSNRMVINYPCGID
jgi:hypothetical protein